MHLEHIFHRNNNLHQNIKFNMGEGSSGEQVFLDTLLQNIMMELYWYIGSLWKRAVPTVQPYAQTSCKESVVSSLLNTIFYFRQR